MAASRQLDDQFMRRAIALGMKGRGGVEPNPMVGCVIAKDGRIIGEGFHQTFGGPHAEPNALAACVESPQGATAYVTLEPCCHLEKKTPPCVPKIIEAGLRRVVIGTLDPSAAVSGKGAQQLRSADIEVAVLDLPAARQLLAPFIARVVHSRPYVTLKWAQTADGKVAGPTGRRIQISGPAATKVIHELRARSDAILVGINTALGDDPLLTVRHAQSARQLIRIVLDSELRIGADLRLVRTAREQKVIVYTSSQALSQSVSKRARLESAGVEVRAVELESPHQLSLRHVIDDIGTLRATHLLIEPGPTLANSFLSLSLWDRAWIIHSPARIDDPTAPQAPNIPDVVVAQTLLAKDQLSECLNPQSDVTFSLDPSADFRLVSVTG